MTGTPAGQYPQDSQDEREAIHVHDLAATAHDPYTAHVHSPSSTPVDVAAVLQAAAARMAAAYTARREEACRAALADGTQGVLADSSRARMDPRVPAGQFWQLPYSKTLADVDDGALDDHLHFLREQLTRPAQEGPS